jgi:cysteine synthase A
MMPGLTARPEIPRTVAEIAVDRAFVELPGFADGFETVVKLEGLNPAGSIKAKTARGLLDAFEEGGQGLELIESTSGSLGVALACLCAERGHRLTVVTDPNTNDDCVRYMKALGATVVIVRKRDGNGGYLQTRIDYIGRELARRPQLIWINQYANPANARAHCRTTGPEIVRGFGVPDWLFIGVGTGGTLMGCLDYFEEIRAACVVVAVDAAGSVTFGGVAGNRWIPGIGSSRRSEIIRPDATVERQMVAEIDTVRMCRWVSRQYGLLLGGSSGSVLAAVWQSRRRIPPNSRVLVLSPDMGDRYLTTIYDDDWVVAHYGAAALDPPEHDPFGCVRAGNGGSACERA